MQAKGNRASSRRFAVIALSVLAADEVVSRVLYHLRYRSGLPFLAGVPVWELSILLFSWVVPLLVVFVVEKRGLDSLGLRMERGRVASYAHYAIISFFLSAALAAVVYFLSTSLAGVDFQLSVHWLGGRGQEGTSLLEGLAEELYDQVVFVGLPEEVFFRGYVMGRLCAWLGDREGLLLSSSIFGLVHVISRILSYGFSYLLPAAFIGISSFLGALVYGYAYMRTGSIAPSAAAHVALNLLPTLLGVGSW